MAKADGYELPDDLLYDRKDHLWARVESETRVRVGLDQFGQKAAGHVAYVKLLPVGRPVQKGRAFGSLEAGKYIGPLRAPVTGTLLEVNGSVLKTPSLVNTDPYGEGWFVVIQPSNLETDVADLVRGAEAIQAWLEAELAEYRAKGLIKED